MVLVSEGRSGPFEELLRTKRSRGPVRGPGPRTLVGATIPLAVGRQANVLGISAAHHRRWAAYAMSFRV